MSSQPQLGMSLSAAIRYIVCGFILNLLPKRPASVLRAAAWTLAGTPGGKPSLPRPLTRPAPRVPSPIALPALDAQRLFPNTTPPAVRTAAAPPTSRHPNLPLQHHADSLPQSDPPRLKSFLEKTLTRANLPAAALLLTTLLTACHPTPTQDLHVFAAASLRQALTETADAFHRANPNVHVVSNVAGSQVLRLQIESGARADLFVSANPDHLDALQRAGLLAESPTVVATNQLVLAVPTANPAGLSGLQDLPRPDRRLVMAAESVPAGAYARRMLALHAAATGQPGFPDAVLQNVISFETNVRQVAAKLELGEADAGFVYRTDVLASDGRLQVIDIPPHVQVTAQYPAAVLRDAASPELAQRFLTFLRSPEAQAILTRHGFAPAA